MYVPKLHIISANSCKRLNYVSAMVSVEMVKINKEIPKYTRIYEIIISAI